MRFETTSEQAFDHNHTEGILKQETAGELLQEGLWAKEFTYIQHVGS